MSSESVTVSHPWPERISRKWWFFALILVLIFAPSFSTTGFDPTEIPQLIIEVLSNPLIYTYPVLFPVFKIIPILLIIGIILFGDKATRIFNIYAAAISALLAILQTMGFTEQYGFAIMTGNMLVYLLVAAFWIWEAIIKQNDFSPRQAPIWRWWVALLAFLAFWFPIDSALRPDFSPLLILTNEAGVTYCMMTPVLLSVLILFYPTVNFAVLRVAGFVGLLSAILNVIQEFFIFPEAWWMGVLHLPLLLISGYAFVLSFRRPGAARVSKEAS